MLQIQNAWQIDSVTSEKDKARVTLCVNNFNTTYHFTINLIKYKPNILM